MTPFLMQFQHSKLQEVYLSPLPLKGKTILVKGWRSGHIQKDAPDVLRKSAWKLF